MNFDFDNQCHLSTILSMSSNQLNHQPSEDPLLPPFSLDMDWNLEPLSDVDRLNSIPSMPLNTNCEEYAPALTTYQQLGSPICQALQPQDLSRQMNFDVPCFQYYPVTPVHQPIAPLHAAIISSSTTDTSQTSTGCPDNLSLSQLLSNMNYTDVVKQDIRLLRSDTCYPPRNQISHNRSMTITYRPTSPNAFSVFTMNTVVGLQHPQTYNGCSVSALHRLLFNFALEITLTKRSIESCLLQELDQQLIMNSSQPIELVHSSSLNGPLPKILYEYTNTSWEIFLINVVLFRANLGKPLTTETHWLYTEVFYCLRNNCAEKFADTLPTSACFINPTVRNGYLYFGAVLEPYIPFMTQDLLRIIFEFIISDEDTETQP